MTTQQRRTAHTGRDTGGGPAPGQDGRGQDRRGPAPGRRPELAAFLRSRRARVTPADVGMPPGLRRRTPGLRREEVAQLSGVGVTWYTWLEQGRPINASPQVLDAVARTLRLDPPEREHLYQLAGVAFMPGRESDTLEVGEEIQGIIDALDPHPAAVYNARYDVLATNPAYLDLFGIPLMDESRVRNVLWTLFTTSERACPVVHRSQELPLMVATLRSGYGRHAGEPAWESFIEALSAASPYFTKLWRSGDVAPPGRRVKTFRHWAVNGDIRLTSVSLTVNGLPECRIVAYTPADEESVGRLAELRARRRGPCEAGPRAAQAEIPPPDRGRDFDCGAKEN